MNPNSKSLPVQGASRSEVNSLFKDFFNVESICGNELVKEGVNWSGIIHDAGIVSPVDACENKITLYTEDLINDYCRLKASGIQFNQRPVYIEEGLFVEFSDPFGNCYTLLEKRNYNED